MDNGQRWEMERRAQGFANLIHRFFVRYHEGLAFLGGLTAYPVGVALLYLLGIK